uniref:Uncharacterized protein n=1 Tax=Panagrolaimus sp. PS1159 TaxID=55785 RepID=A0AC35G162_9BILA
MNHDRNAPPDGVIDVYFELELVHILGIDELKQTMTALVYVDEIWNDPSLAWNPEEFGKLTKTWLPMHKVWRPDLIVFNMLQHEDLLSSVRAPVTITYNGTVECSNPAVYTVSCEINIQMFPLDSQKCALEIASWAYSDEKIRLHSHTEHSLDHYSPNEEWHLLGVEVKEKEYVHEGVPVSEIHYEVSVQRKPLFYFVTLTFPSYVMCATSIVGLFARFSTTGEREERFTLGVSGILTMAVLSLVVSEKVPHSSTSVPLLVAYFLYNMVIVSVASIFTGIVMKLHRKGRFGKEPPEWMLKICLLSKELTEKKINHPFPPNYHHRTSKNNIITSSNNNNTSNNLFMGQLIGPSHNSLISTTESNDISTHHYVKGSIVKNDEEPGQVSFEITEDYRREKAKLRQQQKNGNESCNNPTSTTPTMPPKVIKKLVDLEAMIAQLMEHNGLIKPETLERQLDNRRRRQENNGYVRISERLDGAFMTFFLFAVTIPVAYLFICMWVSVADT